MTVLYWMVQLWTLARVMKHHDCFLHHLSTNTVMTLYLISLQNADDNRYLHSLPPAVEFVLQPGSITVLNNEGGFTANDVRALCDVGQSTKAKAGGGFIGQKGIGFKSVFKVTDAPQVCSPCWSAFNINK